MSDFYEWFDPFDVRERAERAERRAITAHEDGKRAAFAMIADGGTGKFREALDYAAGMIAQRAAEEVLLPLMKSGSMRYDEFGRYSGVIADDMVSAARPGFDALSTADFELSSDERETLTVSVRTIQPFNYHVGMSSLIWR